jgi:hypothetical protein
VCAVIEFDARSPEVLNAPDLHFRLSNNGQTAERTLRSGVARSLGYGSPDDVDWVAVLCKWPLTTGPVAWTVRIDTCTLRGIVCGIARRPGPERRHRCAPSLNGSHHTYAIGSVLPGLLLVDDDKSIVVDEAARDAVAKNPALHGFDAADSRVTFFADSEGDGGGSATTGTVSFSVNRGATTGVLCAGISDLNEWYPFVAFSCEAQIITLQ